MTNFSYFKSFSDIKAEWDRQEKSLIAIDPLIETFAREHGLSIEKNYKAPNRTLRQGYPLIRTIQIYIDEKDNQMIIICVVAYEDRDGIRFIKRDTISTGIRYDNHEIVLEKMSEALNKVFKWNEESLEKSGPLGGPTLWEAIKELIKRGFNK